MSILPELRQIACAKTREAFESAHAGWYLLATLPVEQEDLNFHTAVVANPLDQAEKLLAGDAEQLLRNNRLFLIAKTPRNPWQTKVTIGRASNNDLILRHASVSKLHAYFELRDGSPRTLVDAGSANGTVLNGQAALPDNPMEIAAGSLLQVGDVECELLDAGQLHEAIRALFPTPELLRNP